MKTNILKSSRSKNIIYILLFFVLFLSSILWVIYSKYPIGWDFRNNLYLPSHLLLQSHSPYDIDSLVDNSNAIWFPMVLGIFFPLGLLNLQIASNLWMLLNILALFSLILLIYKSDTNNIIKFFLVSFIVLLLPSTISHLNLGQVSILICLSITVIIMYHGKISVRISGILLAFTLTKPHLVIVFIPAYLLYIYRSRGRNVVLRLIYWIFIGLLLLILPVLLSSQNWIRDFYSNLLENPNWEHPSIITFLSPYLDGNRSIIKILFFLLHFLIAIYLVVRNEQTVTLFWILALTPLFSSYIWSWDFVLMYPLMIFIMSKSRKMSINFLLFGGYIIVLIGFIAQKMAGFYNDVNYWWVPWIILSITFYTQWRTRNSVKS